MKKPLIIGLTGSIGMGKSTAAKILNDMGLPVYNADQGIHDLLAKGGKGVKPVAKLFPDALKDGAIDRKILGQDIFNQPAKLKRLEKILHPLVQKIEKQFLLQAKKQKMAAVILEIPLLFEKGGHTRCDKIICVTAPKNVQKQRVMKRKGMTAERFRAILQLQMPDAEKRKLANFVVHTGKGYADTKRQLQTILFHLRLG